MVSVLSGPLAHFFISAARAAGGKDRLRENEQIERLIGASVEAMGFRLVRVSFGGGSRPVLQIMAEPADGSPMNVEHCADLSRAISALLDVDDPIKIAYTLEVTSPGIDRPLVSLDDYRRFAGFDARLELNRPVDGRKRFKGRIQGIDAAGRISILEEGGTFALAFDDVAKAKLVLTDELLAAAQASQTPQPANEPDPV
jgi:ribosome maturation factor RimP